jgi:hypothetical protein
MSRLIASICALALLVSVNVAAAHTPSQPPHQLFNEGDRADAIVKNMLQRAGCPRRSRV